MADGTSPDGITHTRLILAHGEHTIPDGAGGPHSWVLPKAIVVKRIVIEKDGQGNRSITLHDE